MSKGDQAVYVGWFQEKCPLHEESKPHVRPGGHRNVKELESVVELVNYRGVLLVTNITRCILAQRERQRMMQASFYRSR